MVNKLSYLSWVLLVSTTSCALPPADLRTPMRTDVVRLFSTMIFNRSSQPIWIQVPGIENKLVRPESMTNIMLLPYATKLIIIFNNGLRQEYRNPHGKRFIIDHMPALVAGPQESKTDAPVPVAAIP